MGVSEAIQQAEGLLPCALDDAGQDARWQAISALYYYIESEPESVWAFVARVGSHPLEDLRDAIATCLLEHLLEYHFAVYFPQVRQLALADSLFGDTFLRCWQVGQSQEPGNADLFKALRETLLQRLRA